MLGCEDIATVDSGKAWEKIATLVTLGRKALQEMDKSRSVDVFYSAHTHQFFPFQSSFSTDIYDTYRLHHHHHYVPSVVNKSAVMDLHRSRSCATLIQSLYDIFVHSLMLSVHIVLGLPRPLLPFILPSISNRCTHLKIF